MWINVSGKDFLKKQKINAHVKNKKNKENTGKLFGTDAVVLTGYIEKSFIQQRIGILFAQGI